MRHAAVLVDTNGGHKVIPIDDDVRMFFDILLLLLLLDGFMLQGDLNIAASFDRRGDYVYTGNAKGKVLVLDSRTLEVKASFRILLGTSSATAVKSIEFARRGEWENKIYYLFEIKIFKYDFSCFLINTADRVIRVYDSKEVLACGKDGEPEPIQKLQDLVNKLVFYLN